MSSVLNSIGVVLVLALCGCGESMLASVEGAGGGDAGDSGFSRDTVDVEQAAPSEWAGCLQVSDGRLSRVGEGRRFEPGADIQLEVRLTNLCSSDIVAYPGLRFSSTSEYVTFMDRALYLYGILGNQTLLMATQLILGAEVADGESIEFTAAVTHLGCEDEASDTENTELCDDLSEGYRFSWRVGDALETPEF